MPCRVLRLVHRTERAAAHARALLQLQRAVAVQPTFQLDISRDVRRAPIPATAKLHELAHSIDCGPEQVAEVPRFQLRSEPEEDLAAA